MGKRKIVIEKIQDPQKLMVAFSKRRKGLIQKAAEACRLCGAEIALVYFSPAGKPFSFGHTSVDSVIDRYISGSQPVQAGNGNEKLWKLYREMKEVECELKKEKEKVAAIRKGGPRYWLEQIDVDKYHSVEELQTLADKLEKLRNNALKRLTCNEALIPTSAALTDQTRIDNVDWTLPPSNLRLEAQGDGDGDCNEIKVGDCNEIKEPLIPSTGVADPVAEMVNNVEAANSGIQECGDNFWLPSDQELAQLGGDNVEFHQDDIDIDWTQFPEVDVTCLGYWDLPQHPFPSL